MVPHARPVRRPRRAVRPAARAAPPPQPPPDRLPAARPPRIRLAGAGRRPPHRPGRTPARPHPPDRPPLARPLARRRPGPRERRAGGGERPAAAGPDRAGPGRRPRPGGPATFSPEQIVQIVAVACEPPERSGRPISHWSARELAEEVKKRQVVSDISARTVSRFLKAGRAAAAQEPVLAERQPG